MVAPSVLPGRAFQRIDRVSRLAFSWRADELGIKALTGQLGTFARPSAGSAVDRLGLGRYAVHSQPRFDLVDRDSDGIRERALLLLEDLRTQLVTDPENIGNWTATTTTRTAGQPDPFGGTGAYLLTPTGGVASQIEEVVAFTGDGTKAILGFMLAGTSGRSRIAVFDNTAATNRYSVFVTWAAGVPTLSDHLGAGTKFNLIPWADGWYAIAISANSVVAANSNRYRVFPDDLNGTGTVFFFGANAWNATFPSSYQGPSLATKSAEALSYSYLTEVMATWALVDFEERGSILSGANQRIIQLGTTSGGAIYFTIFKNGNFYAIQFKNGSTTVTTTLAATPALRDRVRILAGVNDLGNVSIRQIINTGAESAVGPSAANALPIGAQWSGSILAFNDQGELDGVQRGFTALQAVKIGLGAMPASIAAAEALAF